MWWLGKASRTMCNAPALRKVGLPAVLGVGGGSLGLGPGLVPGRSALEDEVVQLKLPVVPSVAAQAPCRGQLAPGEGPEEEPHGGAVLEPGQVVHGEADPDLLTRDPHDASAMEGPIRGPDGHPQVAVLGVLPAGASSLSHGERGRACRPPGACSAGEEGCLEAEPGVESSVGGGAASPLLPYE